MKGWDILFAIFRDHSDFNNIIYIRKGKNGEEAYKCLRDKYLGPNAINNMATDLEAQGNILTYTSETRRWDFEKYRNRHCEMYARAKELQYIGYSGVDIASRARKLMNGIRTDKLETVKTSIYSTPSLRSDFDASSSLSKVIVAHHGSLHTNHSRGKISATEIGANGGGHIKCKGR